MTTPDGVTTDSTGSAWLLYATDSGLEGTTTVYYAQVRVTAVAN